jgi:DNA-directed RNA polymerase beta' subunit
VRTPEGETRPHDLTTLYGRLIALNARLARLVELGAPEQVWMADKAELAKDVARLFDNEGCGEDALLESGHPPKGLAAGLGTNDAQKLAAILMCLGIKAVKA